MTRPFPALYGLRILGLAQQPPGPAALARCRAMGATCVELKTQEIDGRALQRQLARTDILLTSVPPSQLQALGLNWKELHSRYPGMSQVAILGAPRAGLLAVLLVAEAVLKAALRRQERYAGTGEGQPPGLYLEVPLPEDDG
jgi:hypothetical protein